MDDEHDLPRRSVCLVGSAFRGNSWLFDFLSTLYMYASRPATETHVLPGLVSMALPEKTTNTDSNTTVGNHCEECHKIEYLHLLK